MVNTARSSFPTTDWGLFADIRGKNPTAKMAAMDIIVRRYWRPVFMFLRHRGCEEEQAKDSTQSFFAEWIENDVFAKADERKGRFRSFMLSCLKRFVANERRADLAQKRRPAGGLFSLDELMADPDVSFEPGENKTPEAAFQKAWAVDVVQRVLHHLENECTRTEKQAHYDIFARRVIRPILEGCADIALADLGRVHGLTEKQAANHLQTAKRAYQRLLQEEIRLYADSEAEVAEEIRDIFKILGQT